MVFLIGLGAAWDIGSFLALCYFQVVHPHWIDSLKKPIGLSWFAVPLLLGLLGAILGIAGRLPGTEPLSTRETKDNKSPSSPLPVAIASFILALLSLALGPLSAIPAVLCGWFAISKLRNACNDHRARQLARSGLAIACIALSVQIPIIVIGCRAYHCHQIEKEYPLKVKNRTSNFAKFRTSKIPSEMARSVLGPLIPENSAVGIVVGITGRTGRSIFSCGDPNFDGNTMFEIGSVTKVFTGTILATMIQDGLIRESDPIGKFVPQNGVSSNPALQEIKVSHLATHTAGLPGLPNNVSKARMTFFGLTRWGDPYHGYPADRLYEAIRTAAPKTTPGKTMSYSNFGMGLLGQILADLEHTDYERLLLKRVCDKLNMQRTRIHLSSQLSKDLASGHLQNGEPASNWDLGALAGAGGIKSCINDLLIFVEEHLSPTNEALAGPIQMTMTPRHQASTNTAVGLAWFRMQRDNQTIWFHNGGTGGYSAFVGIDKDAGIGLVVLANACFANELTGASFEFLSLLAKNRQTQEPKTDEGNVQ